MVPFGQNAAAVIGGQSSNLTIQDEIHVFRQVLLLLTYFCDRLKVSYLNSAWIYEDIDFPK